jgi:hypothetical protein
MSDGGKGSKQRPTNFEKFSNNYDQIFGKKNKLILPMPGTIGSAKVVFKEKTKQEKNESLQK